jgi:ELWxxDGT repeat protein
MKRHRIFLSSAIALTSVLIAIGCTEYKSTPGAGVTTVVEAGLLKDINPGVPDEVWSSWVKVSGALYFVANNNHKIWKSTTAGVVSLVKDLGLRDATTLLLADERSTSTATRFYFIVNGVQVWMSNGTTTSKIDEIDDGSSIISSAVIGNHLYYQLSTFEVYKSADGAAPIELTTAGASFAAAVTFVRGSTTMYMHGNHATDHVVYSHTGSLAPATTVQALGAGAVVGSDGVLGNHYYFQVNGGPNDNLVFKSVTGVAAIEVEDDTPVSFAEVVTFVAGSTHMYMHGNHATDHVVYSHTGAATNADLVGALGANASVGASGILGDDFYYQVDDADTNENDNMVFKSVAGGLAAEVQANTNSSFSEDVTFLAGTSIMYMYGNHATDWSIYSHSGVAATDATLVGAAAVGANAVVSAAATLGNNLYYQVEDADGDENDELVFKYTFATTTLAGIFSTGIIDFAADVGFIAGSAHMYIYGNDAANSVLYSHTGTAAAATTVFEGGTGVLQVAKMKIVTDALFFHGRTTPVGLFISAAGAEADALTDFITSQDDNYLCATPYVPVNISTRLFFVANDGGSGCELWSTTGTSATTVRVDDINSGVAHSDPTDLTVVATRLYFTAVDAAGDRDLYYSDTPYTSATKVILTGADAPPDLRFLTAVGSKLYFAADIGGVPTVYAHTGAAAAAKKSETAGATDLKVDAAADPSIVAVGTMAIIRGAPLATANYELYFSDSTDAVAASATLLREINAAGSSAPILSEVVHDGTTLFFTADDNINGRELWKTQGTLATTLMIRNINQDVGGAADSDPTLLTLAGDKLFFNAVDGASAVDDSELWVSASPFTSAVKLTSYANDSVIASITAFGDNAILTASEDNGGTSGVYISDGTVAGTTRLLGAIPMADTPTFHATFANLEDSRFFFVINWASDGKGKELWTTDGTVDGTMILKDLKFGAGDGVLNHDDFSQVGGELVFVGDNGTSGSELWSTNVDGELPRSLGNLNPDDSTGVAPGYLGSTTNAAYYILNDGVNGSSIYQVQ